MKTNSHEIDAEQKGIAKLSRIARYLGRTDDTLRRQMKASPRLRKIIRRDEFGEWVAHRDDLDAYLRSNSRPTKTATA